MTRYSSISSQIENGELDLLWHMSQDQPSIKTKTCKSPRVWGAPFRSVDAVFVLCPHLTEDISGQRWEKAIQLDIQVPIWTDPQVQMRQIPTWTRPSSSLLPSSPSTRWPQGSLEREARLATTTLESLPEESRSWSWKVLYLEREISLALLLKISSHLTLQTQWLCCALLCRGALVSLVSQTTTIPSSPAVARRYCLLGLKSRERMFP